MEPKIIKTEAEYFEAIKYLEEIDNNPDFESNAELIKKSELLEKYIESYDKEHYPIEKGNPIEIIKLRMQYMELKPKDLITSIGSKSLVSEILNKKRKLSKKMIRELSNFLNISQEILNTEYELEQTKTKNPQKIKIERSSCFTFQKNTNLEIEEYSRNISQRKAIFNVMQLR